MPESIAEHDIVDLVARVEESADALMAGDIDRYLALVHHADDYTLLNPAGGPARRGFDESRRAGGPWLRCFNPAAQSWS